MVNLYIRTTDEKIFVTNVQKDIKIYAENGIVYFGNEAAVNINNFISYVFQEVNE
jgi:hypothetical protein